MVSRIHEQQQRALRYYENKKDDIRASNRITEENKKDLLNFLHDCEVGKTIKKGKRTIEPLRLVKIAGILQFAHEQWLPDINFRSITENQLEFFIDRLQKGKITNKYGHPYKHESVISIKKILKKYFKWINGGKEHPLLEWVDTTTKTSEPRAIPGLIDGIKSMSKLASCPEARAILWTLFDSGFRRSELYTCSVEDLSLQEDCFYLHCPSSKTKTRTVPLPIATPFIKEYLESRPPHKKGEPFFTYSERGLYKMVTTLSLRCFGEAYSPHDLRHSSCTYYASRLDRASLCKRYGWSYSSKVPDSYLDLSQIEQKKVVQAIKKESYDEMQEKIDMLVQEKLSQQEQIKQLSAFINELHREVIEARIVMEGISTLDDKDRDQLIALDEKRNSENKVLIGEIKTDLKKKKRGITP